MANKRTHCDCGEPATTTHANEYVCEECKRVVTLACAELDKHMNTTRDRESKYCDAYWFGELGDNPCAGNFEYQTTTGKAKAGRVKV